MSYPGYTNFITLTSRAHSYCSDFDLTAYTSHELYGQLCNSTVLITHFDEDNKSGCHETFSENIISFNATVLNSTIPEIANTCGAPVQFVNNSYFCQTNDVIGRG